MGWLVLATVFALRAYLAWSGGQLFWPDEDRFEIARRAAGALLDGRVHDGANLVFTQPEHLLFKIAALIPATIEAVAGLPGWTSALFFAAVSTWVIWLVGCAARAAGGSPLQGFVALFLAACTTSLFYYSRHFLPYDFSLGLLLVALCVGLRENASRRNSLLVGIGASLGYLAYNSYWALGGLVVASHALLALPHPRAVATRLVYAVLGLALPVLAVAFISRLFGHDFFALTFQFAATADQGELEGAAEFAITYFWVTERGLAVLWGVALLMSLDRTGRSSGVRAMLWPGLVIALGILLIVPPVLWHHFAVTARHLRPLAPLLCLTAAMALCEHPVLRRRPAVLAGMLVAVALQAAFNFSAPLAQVFPRDFEKMAADRLGELRREDLGPYKIFNASFLHDPDWAPAGPDPGRIVFRRPHPFEFPPYLFEGYSTAIRERYLERDLSMRVIRLAAGGPPVPGYPEGMIELTLRFPARPRGLLPEPILTTGAPGQGDTIFINYDGLDHVILGHDHIGGGAVHAPRLAIDRGATHRILIGMDTFFPPGTFTHPPRRFVQWNDTVLLFGSAELHPTAPEQIAIGHNFIGSSTATTQLSAEILSFRRVPFPRLGSVFAKPPGALRLKLLLNDTQPEQMAEPLLSSGTVGRGDLLFIRREADGRFRLGHDHWGGGAELSESFAAKPSQATELIIAMGPFLPVPSTDGGDVTSARRLYARHGDQVLFNRLVTFHPSAAGELGVGENLIASTSVSARLTTEFLACEPVSPVELARPPLVDGAPVRLHLRFFGSLTPGRTDPLISTGRAGAGDLLFIRFDGEGNFQVGHDHWGHAVTMSKKFPMPADQILDLTLSFGALDPGTAEFARLRNRLFVATPAGVILNQPADFHPAPSDSWAFGLNRIGASTASELIGADLTASSSVPAAEILDRITH